MQRKKRIPQALKRIRHLKHVYIAFVVDTTGSMRHHHINGVKHQLREIYNQMHAKALDDVSRSLGYFFGKVNRSTDTMLEIFARAYGRPITSFDVENPVHITESVLSASTESMVRGMKESTVLSSGPVKVVELVKKQPEWQSLPLIPALLINSKHPMSIRDIREYGELKRSTRKTLVKVAPAPFAAGFM